MRAAQQARESPLDRQPRTRLHINQPGRHGGTVGVGRSRFERHEMGGVDPGCGFCGQAGPLGTIRREQVHSPLPRRNAGGSDRERRMVRRPLEPRDDVGAIDNRWLYLSRRRVLGSGRCGRCRNSCCRSRRRGTRNDERRSGEDRDDPPPLRRDEPLWARSASSRHCGLHGCCGRAAVTGRSSAMRERPLA